jgi:hypothetical protein
MQNALQQYFDPARLQTSITYLVDSRDDINQVADVVEILARERKATVEFTYLGQRVITTPLTQPGETRQIVERIEASEKARTIIGADTISYTPSSDSRIWDIAERMIEIAAMHSKRVIALVNDIAVVAQPGSYPQDLVREYDIDWNHRNGKDLGRVATLGR